MNPVQIRTLKGCVGERIPGGYGTIATASNMSYGRGNFLYLCRLKEKCEKQVPGEGINYCDDSFPPKKENEKKGEKQ